MGLIPASVSSWLTLLNIVFLLAINLSFYFSKNKKLAMGFIWGMMAFNAVMFVLMVF